MTVNTKVESHNAHFSFDTFDMAKINQAYSVDLDFSYFDNIQERGEIKSTLFCFVFVIQILPLVQKINEWIKKNKEKYKVNDLTHRDEISLNPISVILEYGYKL